MHPALISRQHRNDVAFPAIVKDIERIGVNDVVCLGDVVQGGDEAAQTLDRLASGSCYRTCPDCPRPLTPHGRENRCISTGGHVSA